MNKPKVKDIVRIVFLDHCAKNGSMERGPVCFEAFGRIIAIEDDFISIAPWIQPEGIVDENTDTYEILISTIKTIEKLGG